MPSTSVLTATNFLQVGDGTVYTNASNAEALDGAFATVSLSASGGAEGLGLYTYNAAIPGNATIVGVEVPLTAKSSVASTTIASVSLIQNFGVISIELVSSALATTNATVTIGGPTELWGADLTPNIINDPTFGIVVYLSTGSAAIASVDAGQIKIYYTIPSGIPNSLLMTKSGI
jgi:hypothetical protein